MTRLTGVFNEYLCSIMVSRSRQKLIEGLLHFRLKKITLNVQAVKTVSVNTLRTGDADLRF